MKRYYEIYMMQHVSGSDWDDWQTVNYISGYGYHKTYQMAKELSKHYGEIEVSGMRFPKQDANKEFYQQPLDEGLAMVKLVCSTENEMTTYDPIYWLYFEGGKVWHKEVFD